MPMYDYICNSCGNKFDKLVSFTASDKDIEMPSMLQKTQKKQLCAPNISNGIGNKKVKTPVIHPLDILEHNF